VRHETLAHRLIAAKAEVLATLRMEVERVMFPLPVGPCRHCGGRDYWRRPRGQWLCGTCHPVPYHDAVAGECQSADAGPPLSGLADEVKEALSRFEWEPADGLGFPVDTPDASVTSAMATAPAPNHVAPTQGVLDVG
jgi:hypothetical protein